MKIEDIYNITLREASKKSSERIKVGLLLSQLCGGGRKTICDRECDLREAVDIMHAGFTDTQGERLERLRHERTGVLYDENGTIAEEFSETVGDLVDALNMGDFQCSLSAK